MPRPVHLEHASRGFCRAEEHTCSPRTDPLTVRGQGDHLRRDPEPAVRAAGLVVHGFTRCRAGIVLRRAASKPG
ncbi:MAG TPA: hypothetical protein VK053_11940 [Jiangellaceae bacterium]|nr:hypothetical protein [Jiangellaceae bacterium]